ncbi:MAG: hypothetical protein ACYC0T_09220 [Ramlibacter sp.]
MRHDVRKKLLADYAVALVAERESWGRLHEPDLTEAERCRILGEWKQIAAGLKTLVRQLRDVPADPVFEPERSRGDDADPVLPPEAADGWELMADAAAVAGAAVAPALRRPFHVQCLLASLRLMAMLRARLESAVPRLGPL